MKTLFLALATLASMALGADFCDLGPGGNIVAECVGSGPVNVHAQCCFSMGACLDYSQFHQALLNCEAEAEHDAPQYNWNCTLSGPTMRYCATLMFRQMSQPRSGQSQY